MVKISVLPYQLNISIDSWIILYLSCKDNKESALKRAYIWTARGQCATTRPQCCSSNVYNSFTTAQVPQSEAGRGRIAFQQNICLQSEYRNKSLHIFNENIPIIQ